MGFTSKLPLLSRGPELQHGELYFKRAISENSVFSCTNRCKPGFFNLGEENPAGCQPCFCFGHSVACTSASFYSATNITSDFYEGNNTITSHFNEIYLKTTTRHVYTLLIYRTSFQNCTMLHTNVTQLKSVFHVLLNCTLHKERSSIKCHD